MKTTAILAGIAAEYFVAAELSRRGFIASITLKNTEGIDVVVVDSTKMTGIQVKSKQNAGKLKKWLLKESDGRVTADNLFYAFVDLKMKTGNAPEIYIVPAKVVAAQIKENHKKFLASGGSDNPMREFRILDDAYLNNWEILELFPKLG